MYITILIIIIIIIVFIVLITTIIIIIIIVIITTIIIVIVIVILYFKLYQAWSPTFSSILFEKTRLVSEIRGRIFCTNGLVHSSFDLEKRNKHHWLYAIT